MKELLKPKYGIGIGVFLIIAIIAYMNREAIKNLMFGSEPATPDNKDKTPTTKPATPTSPTTPTTAATNLDYNKTLKVGTKGDEVKILQTLLNAELAYRKANPDLQITSTGAPMDYSGKAPLIADGDFGDRTESLLQLLLAVKQTTLASVKANADMQTLKSGSAGAYIVNMFK